jgi:hypothetical protein
VVDSQSFGSGQSSDLIARHEQCRTIGLVCADGVIINWIGLNSVARVSSCVVRTIPTRLIDLPHTLILFITCVCLDHWPVRIFDCATTMPSQTGISSRMIDW